MSEIHQLRISLSIVREYAEPPTGLDICEAVLALVEDLQSEDFDPNLCTYEVRDSTARPGTYLNYDADGGLLGEGVDPLTVDVPVDPYSVKPKGWPIEDTPREYWKKLGVDLPYH